jgi:Protein of unknown function (DUF3574)
MGKMGMTQTKLAIVNLMAIAGLLLVPKVVESCDCTKCSTIERPSSTIDLQQKNSQSFTREELYFGLSEPEGITVSEAQWQLFLNRVIMPRFDRGLTILDANGQYLNTHGKMIRENTKLVILIYQSDRAKDRLIEEIMAIYKKMFHQESVLRVTSSARVSF